MTIYMERYFISYGFDAFNYTIHLKMLLCHTRDTPCHFDLNFGSSFTSFRTIYYGIKCVAYVTADFLSTSPFVDDNKYFG